MPASESAAGRVKSKVSYGEIVYEKVRVLAISATDVSALGQVVVTHSADDHNSASSLKTSDLISKIPTSILYQELTCQPYFPWEEDEGVEGDELIARLLAFPMSDVWVLNTPVRAVSLIIRVLRRAREIIRLVFIFLLSSSSSLNRRALSEF